MPVYYNDINTGRYYLGSQLIGTQYFGSTVLTPGQPGWSPADMQNFVAWYRADTGVTYDGNNNVTAWAPVSSSLAPGISLLDVTLTVKSGGTSPKYLSSISGMNNKPGIQFGTVSTTENLRTSATNSVFNPGNGCFNWYVIDTNTNAFGGGQTIGGPAGEFDSGGGYYNYSFTNYPSYNNAYTLGGVDGNVGPFTNLQSVASYPKALFATFVNTNPSFYTEGGYYLNDVAGSPNNLWNTTQGYIYAGSRRCIWILGNTNALDAPFYGTILEAGITGVNGSADWVDLQNYVQARYNLDFSI